MKQHRSILVLTLALSACAVPRASEELPHAAPITSAAPSVSSAAPVVPPAPSANVPVDPRIGAACRQPAAPAEICVLCDKHDRIAGVVMMGDLIRIDDARVFRRSVEAPPTATAPRERQRELQFMIAADPAMLSAQVLTCPGCRRQMGWGALVSLAALGNVSPAVRSDLQIALGYSATPLLDGAAGFVAAKASNPPSGGFACPDGIRR